ncbi:hypothetical protein [Geminicoccus harenae]|uniref:hypothetical protein n=1 Tax=Geminicoccus harenae TaxID=2498453 RepID=UPI00168BBC74|nr:hypothetical protein [Geminicoccus harenae]
MSAPQLERVADLQALVLGALKHIGKSVESGHRHKAASQLRELRIALGDDAAALPAPKSARASKGIDWPSELARAEREGLSQTALARKLGVVQATVWAACRRYGKTLPVDPAAPANRFKNWRSGMSKAEVAPKPEPQPQEPAPVEPRKLSAAPRPTLPVSQPRSIMDGWKRNRIRTLLMGTRKLDEIATLTALPLAVVEAEAVAWREGR